MLIADINKFAGMLPGVAPHLLPMSAAQIASSCKLISGALRPWKDTSFVATPAKVGTILGLFLYEDTYWFHWITDVNCVYGPIAQDSHKRAYWTGDSAPKMTVLGIGVAGPDYPTASYLLGIPAPTTSLSAAATGTADTPEDETLFEDRAYIVTYVSAYGEEGPPCDPSTIIEWKPGESVSLTSIPTGPSGNYNITHKKVYRTNTGSTSTSYQLVITSTYPTGLIPIATTTMTDDCDSDELGDVLPSAEWDPPPSDLSGLIVLPNGCLCGFTGKEVCFSDPYYPHAWPLSYRVPVDRPIKSIGAFGSTILVTTKGFPYLITCDDPSTTAREKLEKGQACVSKRGTVDMGYSVLYPGVDGLFEAGINGFSMVTEGVLTRDEWQALVPSSIHAYQYAGFYIGFYDTGSVQGCFIFNPATKDYTTLDLYATAGHSDPSTGKLYLVIDGDIEQWDAGDAIPYQWYSRPFYTVVPVNAGWARVFADAYPVTLKLYADGSLQHTQTVADNNPFPLPSGYLSQKWEIDLSGANNVNIARLATTIEDLGEGSA